MTLDELLLAVQAGRLSPEQAERELLALRRSRSRIPGASSGIAVIGIAGRFAESESMDELWQHLRAGHDLIREIPPERWHVELETDDEQAQRRCRWGGFMRNVGCCDHEFFAALPERIELTDPDELAFVEIIWTLLERAGYSRAELRRVASSDVGLYLGARANGVPGALPVVLANRVSSFFGLLGPSFAIDSMSASSMSAVHLACQALTTGDCRMAIAAGISLLSEASYARMQALGILAESSEVRSFSQGRAMLPSEAMCAVLLKPLTRALEDGDDVLAVIRATAMANAGTFSQTAPPRARLISRVLTQAGIDARTIGHVETSAAGDALADAVEIAALTSAFRPYDVGEATCPVASVKSNLGHALAASGMTQLAKVVLQLRHGELVPSIKADPDFPATPFRLQRELGPWRRAVADASEQAPQFPRRALIDSFGGGGSIVCVLIEEFERDAHIAAAIERTPAELIVLSAATDAHLGQQIERLCSCLERNPDVSSSDLAFTLQCGRETLQKRLAIRAERIDELRIKLRSLMDDPMNAAAAEGIWISNSQANARGAHDAMPAPDDLEALAQRWVGGASVDWAAVRAGRGARRIELPTYPFQRTRHPG